MTTRIPWRQSAISPAIFLVLTILLIFFKPNPEIFLLLFFLPFALSIPELHKWNERFQSDKRMLRDSEASFLITRFILAFLLFFLTALFPDIPVFPFVFLIISFPMIVSGVICGFTVFLRILINNPNGPLTVFKPVMLVLLLGVISGVVTITFLFYSLFIEGTDITRPRVARAKSEIRYLAVILETYYLDHKQYPPPNSFTGKYISAPKNPETGEPDFTKGVWGFLSPALTTPIAYTSVLPTDPFAPGNQTYLYATNFKTCWILMSRGPDKEFDPSFVHFATLGEAPMGNCDWKQFLSQFGEGTIIEYDGSNGTVSPGHVIRVGP